MAKKKPRLSLGTIPPAPASSASSEAQAAFMAGDGKRLRAKTSKRSNVEEPKHKAWERFTLYLPPEVAKALRHRAVDAGQDMSDVAAAALRTFLGKPRA